MLLTGLTLGMIGKVLLGVAVIRVHAHVSNEHKIDRDVIRAISREKITSIKAILLIISGYILEVAHLGFAESLLFM